LGTFPPVLTEGVVVPSGTAAELDGPWRKTALPAGPITLQPGGYALGGLDNISSTDSIRYILAMGSGGPIADNRIEIGAPGASEGTGFTVPTFFFLVDGVEFGPMLFIEPVPEPTCEAMILLAIGCLTLSQSRAR
jgi:hypothetical protein